MRDPWFPAAPRGLQRNPSLLFCWRFCSLWLQARLGGGVEITANPGVGKPFSESACPRGTGQGGDQL